ncbi:MAG: NAD(P)-dependent oxidoreductase [Magnetococcales bacterium]|nr:NAD(P)-dependent oxidoreductase [Magnetococcales bacterium]
MTLSFSLIRDLPDVLQGAGHVWEGLRGQRLFLTGGTGFVGLWLLESLSWANEQLDLGVEVTVLTRSPKGFAAAHPNLAGHRAIRLHWGDVRDFEFPGEKFDYIIHGAAPTSIRVHREEPVATVENILDGTRRTLNLARRCGAKRFLLISSGAVYGSQPFELVRIPEHCPWAPDAMDPVSAFGGGKRMAETLGAAWSRESGMEFVAARCFSFIGPGQDLTAHYEAGNYIRDALVGGPIRVAGDGTALSSYLYGSDLAVWLLTVLVRGQAGQAYNVGSDQILSLAELARLVAANCSPEPSVWVEKRPKSGQTPTRYIPDVSKVRKELGLVRRVGLERAIEKTFAWHRERVGGS